MRDKELEYFTGVEKNNKGRRIGKTFKSLKIFDGMESRNRNGIKKSERNFRVTCVNKENMRIELPVASR